MNHCKPSILPLKGVGCCIIEFLDCTIKQGTDKYLRQRRQKTGAFFLKTTEAEPSAELVNSNATANWGWSLLSVKRMKIMIIYGIIIMLMDEK